MQKAKLIGANSFAGAIVCCCLAGVLVAVWGCHHSARRFSLAPVLWQDPDRNHTPHQPDEQVLGTWSDAVDKTIFGPLSALFALPLEEEAINVNSLDEVPNSAWFTNRIGLFAMSNEQIKRGSCDAPAPDPRNRPWRVVRAKTEGQNPGFFIKLPDNRTYLLKFDGSFRPQRATAADVIGSKFYHAAGYNAPCNDIIYFPRAVLTIAKDAVAVDETGEKRKLVQADVDLVLNAAFRRKSGLIRAAASRFLPGKPIGPFLNEGTRGDDPNDIIPHEDRRELRANRLLAAWLNHFDSRSANSLDMYVTQQGRSFVRHYMIDFGDCFGGSGSDLRLNRLVGKAYYIDLANIFIDFISLGFVRRPWERSRIDEQAEIFGFFSSEKFVASQWKGIYPNPAFDRMTFRDALWMVRILVRFSAEHIRAAVQTAQLENPQHEAYLVKTLIERRDQIAKEYLTRYVPLDRFRLIRRDRQSLAQSLCFEDLAIRYAGIDPSHVLYKIRVMGGSDLDQLLGWLQFVPDPNHAHRSCVLLPVGDKRPAELAGAKAADDDPDRYAALDIQVYEKPYLPPRKISVHLVDLGQQRGFRIVGIERHPNLIQRYR